MISLTSSSNLRCKLSLIPSSLGALSTGRDVISSDTSDGAKAAFEVGKGKQPVLVLSEAQVMELFDPLELLDELEKSFGALAVAVVLLARLRPGRSMTMEDNYEKQGRL